MSQKETLVLFTGCEGVGNRERGISDKQTADPPLYQLPYLPHSHGSRETTQTPHFHNRRATLNLNG